MRELSRSDIRFSVVIAAHNSSQWLAAALESVFRQTFIPFEVLVFNDSSQDSLSSIELMYPEVKFRDVNYKNAAATRNEALKYIKGNYIAFLDADDKWLEDHLSKATDAILSTPALVGYINAFDYLDLADKIIHKTDSWSLEKPTPMNSVEYIDFLERSKYFVGMSACIVSSEKFKEIGGFDPVFKRRHDLEMWMRLLAEEIVVVDPNKTSLYRKNVPSSLSSGNWETEFFRFKAFEKNGAHFSEVYSYTRLTKRTAIQAIHNAILHGGAEFQKKVYKHVQGFLPWYLQIGFYSGVVFPKGYRLIYRLTQ